MTRSAKLALLAYGLVIVGLAVWAAWPRLWPPKKVSESTSTAEIKAKRPLGRNHLVQAEDLEGTDSAKLSGSYAKSRIEQGDAVEEDDFTPLPALMADEETLVGLPVPRALVESGAVNAGRIVLVCFGGTAASRPARVEAVLCTKEAPACTALMPAAELGAGQDIRKLRVAADTCAPSRDAAAPAAAPEPKS